MAFFVQQPERRNLLLEGILGGIDRGQQEASQLRMQERQQAANRSALSSILGSDQSESGQGMDQASSLMQDPIKFAAFLSSSGADKDTQQNIWKAYSKKLDMEKITPSEISNAVLSYKGLRPEDLQYLPPDQLTELQEAIQYAEQNSQGGKVYRSISDFFGKKEKKTIDNALEQPEVDFERGDPSKPRTIAEMKDDIEARKLMRNQGITETKDIRKELTTRARTAKENNQRLAALEKLNNEKELGSSIFYKALEKYGFNIGGLLSPDQEVYQKAVNDFTTSAKNTYGGRVTNFELERFMSRLPTLLNSKEGRGRIIDMQKLQNEADILRDKVKQNIIKENKGFPPIDLEDRIEERIAPQLDKWAEKYAELASGDRIFDEFPEAKKYKDQEIEDEETGDIYYSNGKEWIKR